jgi:hypothetical protein
VQNGEPFRNYIRKEQVRERERERERETKSESDLCVSFNSAPSLGTGDQVNIERKKLKERNR